MKISWINRKPSKMYLSIKLQSLSFMSQSAGFGLNKSLVTRSCIHLQRSCHQSNSRSLKCNICLSVEMYPDSCHYGSADTVYHHQHHLHLLWCSRHVTVSVSEIMLTQGHKLHFHLLIVLLTTLKIRTINYDNNMKDQDYQVSTQEFISFRTLTLMYILNINSSHHRLVLTMCKQTIPSTVSLF